MKSLLFIGSIFLMSCNEITEQDAIKNMIHDLIEADNRGDIVAVLSHYSNEAILMPPGKTSISGTENLKANYQNIFATTHLELETSVEGVEVNRFSALAWGHNIGKAISLRDSTVRQINDKYLIHLIKVTGEWKIERLI